MPPSTSAAAVYGGADSDGVRLLRQEITRSCTEHPPTCVAVPHTTRLPLGTVGIREATHTKSGESLLC